jgi:hypothetical protein
MLPLKDATSQKHRLAEKMPFNIRMFRGLLTKDQYLLYLTQQLPIFTATEKIGLPHINLRRSDRVQADINELKKQGHYSGIILGGTKSYADYPGSLS